jgi:hypothetical protein
LGTNLTLQSTPKLLFFGIILSDWISIENPSHQSSLKYLRADVRNHDDRVTSRTPFFFSRLELANSNAGARARPATAELVATPAWEGEVHGGSKGAFRSRRPLQILSFSPRMHGSRPSVTKRDIRVGVRGARRVDDSTERFEKGATRAEPGTGAGQKTGTARSALGQRAWATNPTGKRSLVRRLLTICGDFREQRAR